MEHGYAKLIRRPESFTGIVHALGMPAPELLAWSAILVEPLGGLAVLAGAFIPLASIPMAIVLLVAILTVQLPKASVRSSCRQLPRRARTSGNRGTRPTCFTSPGSSRWCWAEAVRGR